MTAEVDPSSAASAIVWKSSDTNVATVDANGLVTTKGIGTVTITAVVNEDYPETTVSDEIEIIVKRNTAQDREQQVYFYLFYPGAVETGTSGDWLFGGPGYARLPEMEREGQRVSDDLAEIITKEPTYYKGKSITVDGTKYYSEYDPDNEKLDYFTVVWDEAVVANGASNNHQWDKETGGWQELVPWTNPPTLNWHCNGHLVLHSASKTNISFYVRRPGSSEFVIIQNDDYVVDGKKVDYFPKTITRGTDIKDIQLPSTDSKSAPLTIVSEDGVTYYFDGWYTTRDCNEKEDFETSRELQDDEVIWYGRYVTNLSYTVKYLEQGTNKPLAAEKTVRNVALGASFSEQAANVPGYEALTDSATIKIEASNNEIIFYYTKRTDLSYTINYYKDSVEEGNRLNAEPSVVNNVTFGETITLNRTQLNAEKP
ncbi:Ig-like domain-containing protein, partial [uncultured Bacteroides sp.]|uniref:Ig-like domain-containing protein n=1 Tax=uncultured Bacteroides sp. TaxID=162156 RepID=UPI00261B038E